VNPLRRAFRRLLYATLAALLVSGGLWEWLRSALLMKVHGGAAMLALVLLGALLASHVPTGWKDARYQKTGIGILAAAAWLIISGHVSITLATRQSARPQATAISASAWRYRCYWASTSGAEPDYVA
jgi:hypothetical protein